ncbi:MAG: DUF3427 domain-containing protein [Planctomycetota bacterium]|nr:MAG: DUF3427 domain-containing protein [Planctomycetota bacterium]
MSDRLNPGLYEALLTDALQKALDQQGLGEQAVITTVEDSLASGALLQHLAAILRPAVIESLKEKRSEISDALGWRQNLIGHLQNHLLQQIKDLPTAQKLKQLEAIRNPTQHLSMSSLTRPDTPLSISALLSGSARCPSLHSQLLKECASCDSADWLVSFIKWSGLRPLLSTLENLTRDPNPYRRDGLRLRIATTSYMGASDAKAIEELLKLPNTEIKFSFDTHRTRLHAKAYIFQRTTQYGSAYIGSANVSKAALDEGLEWIAKISQYELPHVWQQVISTFNSHWQDGQEFEQCTQADMPRIRHALSSEQQDQQDDTATYFDLRPYAFQEGILQDIANERLAGIHKHLVIAATGTGKTMIAAFDYAAQCQNGRQPRLLFAAHREEILKQARASFRQVLRDGSFGELVTGNHKPSDMNHIFCTVQSWHSRGLQSLAADYYEYVVLDEAHHASAVSYQALLDHIRPFSLLGLTATPERQDGRDIRKDFSDTFTHELRLPDAVERRLLCPFHYFGVSDAPNIDLSGLKWQGGGYQKNEVANILDHNDVRARWVLSQWHRLSTDPCHCRALGFCVSVNHALFMADYCQQHGIPAAALHGESSREERSSIQKRLEQREIFCIFTVDLYNEGVDLPFVDTILLLRPTESLTVFLQQLGRGLRLHRDKTHLTVLDFIAPQHRQFRYVDRFRALSAQLGMRVDQQIEDDMPFLPSGCLVHLERQAKDTILANIRQQTLAQRAPQMRSALRQLAQNLGKQPSLQQCLDHLHLDDPDPLLKNGLPSVLCEAQAETALHKALAKGLRNVLSCDDRQLLDSGIYACTQGDNSTPKSDNEELQLALLHCLFWPSTKPGDGSLSDSINWIATHAMRDVLEVLTWQRSKVAPRPQISLAPTGPLSLHCHYTREQILLAMGIGSFQEPVPLREGAKRSPERKCDAFFVTTDKNEKVFSPTTMYEDYAITENLFHWQSQSTTSQQSNTGQRYINHQENGDHIMLFVRERAKLANGCTAPFLFAGPLQYQSHRGNNPITFEWKLTYSLPAQTLTWARRVG